MKFGIWGTTGLRKGVSHVELYRQHLDEVALAEACGFDHYWFFEHHVSASAPMPAPNLMIAAAAQRTSRMRLGNMVNVLPYHTPQLLAEQVAMLDVLTDGRVDVGIGRGGKASEYAFFCIPTGQSRAMFDESIGIIRRIWADENFSFEGKFYRVDKSLPLSPPLVQRPHPPIYVTANSEASLRFAAENDFPFVQLDSLIEDCKRDQAFYRAIQLAHGHTARPRLCLTREVYVAPTDEEARRDAYPYLLEYWSLWGRFTQFVKDGQVPEGFESWYQRAPRLHAMSYEELIDRGLVLVGSPETVARKIRAHRQELDLAVFVCALQLGSMPHDMVARSMRAFSEQVMPLVRDAAVAAA